MTQNSPADKQVRLDDCDVWIIDDAIPVYALEAESDIASSKLASVDCGFLHKLLTTYGDRWEDPPLKALCVELLEKVRQITVFRFPDHAVQHLDRGGPVPDVVVFDWEYGSFIDDDQRAELLQCLLSRCVSAVLIYTNRDVSVVENDIQKLPPYCGKRLAAPRHKSRTDAAGVLSAIQAKLDTSLSARLAKKLRRVTSEAVENLLVRADQLPLEAAVTMISEEAPEDQQFVELLSSKASVALSSCQEVSDSVREWVTRHGVPPAQASIVIDEIVSSLAASIRRAIQYDKDVYDQISCAWTTGSPSDQSARDDLAEAVRKFFSFRLYDQPNDELVRTGDLVSLDAEDTPDCANLNLHMVITPSCDLAHFWKKTGGNITLVRLLPLEESRSRVPRDYQPHSITASNPMLMPSIPVKGQLLDCFLFAHDIRYEYIEKQGNSVQGGEKREFLGYDLLEGRFRRYCKVSEPFLTGILAKISETLFRSGVYDFPKQERDRLKALWRQVPKGK